MKHFFNTRFSLFPLFFLVPPVAVIAQSMGGFVPPDQPPTPPESTISNLGDFYSAVCAVTQWVMVFGLIIGVLFIIYGGVRYVTAGGDSSKEGDAKKTILGAIIGVVFLVLAVAIINIIASFFGAVGFSFSLDAATCGGGGFFGGAPGGGLPTPTPVPPGGGAPPPPPPPPAP